MRLGNYAELQGKSLDYVNAVSSLIWGGHVDHWPDHVKDAVNSIDGLDYDKAIQFIRDKPEKVDAVWQENQVAQLNAGHGGVPLMIFQGEPFFGQDRFDLFYWRLRQSGLTKRREARTPFTTKPLRWPTVSKERRPVAGRWWVRRTPDHLVRSQVSVQIS